MDKDFEIQIKIAVYKPNGEYIKQCNNTTFSDETIKSIMDEVEKELAE
tara:strand:- start:1470 stop:1613 length:144 start_codon:yes stop_codon:yes gene_type:complete